MINELIDAACGSWTTLHRSDKGTFARRLGMYDSMVLAVFSSVTEEETFTRMHLKHDERSHGYSLKIMDNIALVRPRALLYDALKDIMAWHWLLHNILLKKEPFLGRP